MIKFTLKPSHKKTEKSFLNYELAKEEWANQVMNVTKALHSWKLIAFLCLGIMIIAVSGMIYLSTRSTLIPYVIEVDQTGNAKAINPAYQVNYSPTEANIKYTLKEFVRNSRWISLDPVLQNRNFGKCLFYLTPVMQEKLRSISENENLTKLMEDKYTRDVDIKNIIKIAGTTSTYQVKWEEKLYSKSGSLVNISNYLGIFTVEYSQPKDLQELGENPLGIVITDFNFSKEIE